VNFYKKSEMPNDKMFSESEDNEIESESTARMLIRPSISGFNVVGSEKSKKAAISSSTKFNNIFKKQ